MTILIYEDALVPQLAPITTARPACCVTAGSYHLLELVSGIGEPIALHLRKYLRAIGAADLRGTQVLEASEHGELAAPALILNARVIPSVEALRTIIKLIRGKASGVLHAGDQIAAVLRPNWDWELVQKIVSAGQLESQIKQDGLQELSEGSLPMVQHAHEVIAANMNIINGNLEHRIASEDFTQHADGVFMAADAKLGEYVITDTSNGPILIDRGASVGPYTLLRGPVYVGPHCRILEHAAIKDEVSLGHTTKIGGEVEAAVVEPYSNKQHHGFLGHSYLGSWINLGAGTCNSDLKNTYGTVNMEYSSGKAATGMQFLGCVMGDYSKTAINTGIFTGKVIGVCSMMYGFVTSNVPSFVNYARLFGQLATLPPEVMIATQQRMFSRRKVEQRDCDMQLLHDMYRLTQNERDRFGDEIAF